MVQQHDPPSRVTESRLEAFEGLQSRWSRIPRGSSVTYDLRK